MYNAYLYRPYIAIELHLYVVQCFSVQLLSCLYDMTQVEKPCLETWSIAFRSLRGFGMKHVHVGYYVNSISFVEEFSKLSLFMRALCLVCIDKNVKFISLLPHLSGFLLTTLSSRFLAAHSMRWVISGQARVECHQFLHIRKSVQMWISRNQGRSQ